MSGGNRKKLGGNQNPHGEDPSVTRMYHLIPELETTKLPRGGISVDTEAVGRVQVSVFAHVCVGISIFSFHMRILPIGLFAIDRYSLEYRQRQSKIACVWV